MLNGLAGKMKYYLDDGPKQVLSRSDFRLDSITRPVGLNHKQSVVLYIDAPQDQGRSAAVFSSVMSQLIYQKINERRKIMVKGNLKDRDVKHMSLRMDPMPLNALIKSFRRARNHICNIQIFSMP
jgi:hypothetical protein